MNQYDSSALREYLEIRGHKWTDDVQSADFIVVNTCAVREHAQNRALGRIKGLVSAKRKNPALEIGIMGCVAQELGEKLFEKIPELDFVIGTDQIPVIAQIADGTIARGIFVQTRQNFYGVESNAHINSGRVSSFVTIMRGCDNFCSYCIVPYVRGRERSLPPDRIIAEIENAVANGVREITLLGQNVNSYDYGGLDFPELLEMVANIDNLARIRFVTNHPKDFSEKLLDIVEKYPDKIPPAFHLPIQSGSDNVLHAMNRKYTSEQYFDIVDSIYKKFPDAAISTDIITGFPGESEADFDATISAMKRVRFSGTFSFRYSVRQGTAASKLLDNVPNDVKIERLNRVISTGLEIAEEYSQNLIGTVQNVLVEGKSRKNPGKLRATAPSGRTVLIDENSANIGDIVTVKITDAKIWILWGEYP